jgi:hypothetical protein
MDKMFFLGGGAPDDVEGFGNGGFPEKSDR